jgi:(p)ppGpp synthase/HD superfamily hydrolase
MDSTKIIYWGKQITIARSIAENAHSGQFRKDGNTKYITHPVAVSELVTKQVRETELLYLSSVALLHDVLEDTSVSIKDLASANIDRKIIEGVVVLSRFANESYFEYILRVAKNKDCTLVKIADIVHNLSTLGSDAESLRTRYYSALLILGGLG